MKKWLFSLVFALWSCGSSGDNILNTETSQIDRAAQTGGNFLDLTTFPIGQLEFGADRDDFEALIDQAMVAPNDPTATYVRREDLVLGIEINGDVRAYPHNIFWWHEIANDIVGGVPIIVTFCPLTGTGIAFDARDSDGSRIILGVSGLLFNNNLVMYDQRDQETLYSQITGLGITGPRKGTQLKQIPIVETTWSNWLKLHPTSRVLSGLTNFDPGGIYTLNPYVSNGIDSNRDVHEFIPFPLTLPFEDNPIGPLLQSKELVLGLRFGEIAKAYPFVNMGDRAVINDAVSGTPFVVIWDATNSMALPFFRIVDGRELTFDMIQSDQEVFPFLLKDRETGTIWNLRGEAIRGKYDRKQLQQLPATNAFWFAWATFWQNTGIY